ncbi:MAG: insulinase family protein [Clostridia bacterium]|nr:insulinase family protein [Clostridia bacterium]
MVITKIIDDGVRIVMENIPHVQSVSIGIWVRTGSANENEKTSGISHFIEHMMFKGTEKRTAKGLAEAADRIGGQMNAFTGKEATCYHIKTLASNVDEACDILLDMFLNSVFDKNEMNKERKVIIEEMKMTEDSPDEDAHETSVMQIFQGSPLERPIIGTRTSLKGINRALMMDFRHEQYTKDSIVVSVAGNIDEDHICSIFEGKFRDFKAKKEKPVFGERNYKPVFRVKTRDIEQSHISIMTPGVSLDSQDYYAVTLLSAILGGSMSSRLFQNIREERGLAYTVFSCGGSYSRTGYFNVYAGVSHDKVKETIGAIRDEFEILAADGVTEDELHMAKQQMKASNIFGQENIGSRMMIQGKFMTILDRTFSQDEFIKNVDAVTTDDIKRVSGLITDMKNYCGTVVTDKKFDLRGFMQK